MNTEKHPEDLIYKTKQFIDNLSRIQDQEFNALSKELGLTAIGEEFLFDYVFNHNARESFDEYLSLYGRTFGEMK